MIKEYFDNKELYNLLNSDEAVVSGAAFYAALLKGTCKSDIIPIDVYPHSLGFERAGGVMEFFFRKNTSIPCKKSLIFTTYADNSCGIYL